MSPGIQGFIAMFKDVVNCSGRQTWHLFLQHCNDLNVSPPPKELRARVNDMQRLIPSDFATMSRQHHFRSITTSVELVVALEAECAMKESGKLSIGFIR